MTTQTINSLNVPYLAVLCLILLAAGAGEYLHLVPAGSFYTFLLLVIGLIAPSPLVHQNAPTGSGVSVQTPQNEKVSG